jgi:serine protease DegQ
MLNRLWLLFAQVVTIFLAAWFITMILKPGWLNSIQNGSLVESITLKEGFYDGSSLSPG